MTVTVSSPNRICDIGLLPHRDTHRAHKENIYGKASHTVSTKDTLYEMNTIMIMKYVPHPSVYMVKGNYVGK